MHLARHNAHMRAQITRRYGALDALVTLTETDAREYRAHGRPAARVVAIPNAVPPLRTPPGGPDPPVVIGVGRLTPQKGFDRLLRAFAPVASAHPEWTLRMRNGPRREPLRRLVDELALAGRVELPGAVQAIDEEMARASVYVLSSRFEGFPMVLLEAMSMAWRSSASTARQAPANYSTTGAPAARPRGRRHRISEGDRARRRRPRAARTARRRRTRGLSCLRRRTRRRTLARPARRTERRRHPDGRRGRRGAATVKATAPPGAIELGRQPASHPCPGPNRRTRRPGTSNPSSERASRPLAPGPTPAVVSACPLRDRRTHRRARAARALRRRARLGVARQRPFLRGLHGLTISAWRLGEHDAAETLCWALLWAQPRRQPQGVRDLLQHHWPDGRLRPDHVVAIAGVAD